MNSITILDQDYLWANKTIETLVVNNGQTSEAYYLYNHEGIYFYLFKYIGDLISFLNGIKKADLHFENEGQLDNYLQNINLSIDK